jgi:hypothetical protein
MAGIWHERNDAMKMKAVLVLAAGLAFAAGALGGVPQVLTFRGVLERPQGSEGAGSMELTFRIYDTAEPQVALWARTLRVPVDEDGVFYAELSDSEGTDPDGIGRSLADALGAVKRSAEIGLTPPDAEELSPRQRISTGVRAALAARTQAADVVYAPAGAVADGVSIDAAAVGSVTVQPGATLAAFPKDCTLTRVEDRELGGGAGSSITVRRVSVDRPNWPASFKQDGFKYAPDKAPCDMFLTYDGPDGAFSVIVPAGGRVEDGGSKAQTIYGTAFGNP